MYQRLNWRLRNVICGESKEMNNKVTSEWIVGEWPNILEEYESED